MYPCVGMKKKTWISMIEKVFRCDKILMYQMLSGSHPERRQAFPFPEIPKNSLWGECRPGGTIRERHESSAFPLLFILSAVASMEVSELGAKDGKLRVVS